MQSDEELEKIFNALKEYVSECLPVWIAICSMINGIPSKRIRKSLRKKFSIIKMRHEKKGNYYHVPKLSFEIFEDICSTLKITIVEALKSLKSMEETMSKPQDELLREMKDELDYSRWKEEQQS